MARRNVCLAIRSAGVRSRGKVFIGIYALTQQAHWEYKEAGMPVEEPPALKAWGEYDFTIHDPDGHCLEFDSPYHQQTAGSNPQV